MLELILAIISFMMAFLPKYGIFITIICSILSIILSALKMKKQNLKEIYIISIVISIVAIIFGIFISYSSSKNNNLEKNNKYAQYIEYNTKDDIKLENGIEMSISNITSAESVFRANVAIKSNEDNVKVSTYDFFLIDVDNNKEYFPLYNEGNASVITLNKNSKTNLNIYFPVKDKVSQNTYLVYKKDNIKIKIKL